MNEQLLNLKFVEEVEKRPLLYNYSLPEYSRKDLTEKAWNEVGKITNLKASECKERWKNLRAVFVRNTKIVQSYKGPKKKKPYYLSEAMKFTLPFIRAMNTTSEQEVSTCEQDQDEQEDDEEGSQQQEPSLSTPQQWELEYRRKKNFARKKKRAFEDVDNCFIEYFNAKKASLASTTSDKGQAKKMFLLSLLPELSEMSDQQMNLFKRQVLELIDDIMIPNGSQEVQPSSTAKLEKDLKNVASPACASPARTSPARTSPARSSFFETIKQDIDDIEDPPEYKVFDNPEEHDVTISD